MPTPRSQTEMLDGDDRRHWRVSSNAREKVCPTALPDQSGQTFSLAPVASDKRGKAVDSSGSIAEPSGLSTALSDSAFGLRLLRVPLRPARGKVAAVRDSKSRPIWAWRASAVFSSASICGPLAAGQDAVLELRPQFRK